MVRVKEKTMDQMKTGVKKPPQRVVDVACDARPLLLFTEIFQVFLERSKGGVNFGDLPLELVRVESDLGAADAGKLLVKLYPSDAFLRFAGTIFAGN
jgi:hypothetical protein